MLFPILSYRRCLSDRPRCPLSARLKHSELTIELELMQKEPSGLCNLP